MTSWETANLYQNHLPMTKVDYIPVGAAPCDTARVRRIRWDDGIKQVERMPSKNAPMMALYQKLWHRQRDPRPTRADRHRSVALSVEDANAYLIAADVDASHQLVRDAFARFPGVTHKQIRARTKMLQEVIHAYPDEDPHPDLHSHAPSETVPETMVWL